MRSVVAILGSIVLLFVGYQAMAEGASQSKDAAVTNGTNSSQAAWNMSTGVFDGVGQAAGPAVVWMGIGAFILICLGFLVYAGSSGR